MEYKICSICKQPTVVIIKGTEVIKRNYFMNEKKQTICTECYYSFGIPKDIDKS